MPDFYLRNRPESGYSKTMHHAAHLRVLFCIIFLIAVIPLFPQAALSAESLNSEPFSFIGMKLDDVLKRFGTPRSVYASRGSEQWQDDVVFVYGEGDFYVYGDRVWQVGLKSVFGIKAGDVKAVALLVLGETARDEGDYLLYNIPGAGWPLSLRVNFSAGRVSAIFVYRPDFQ